MKNLFSIALLLMSCGLFLAGCQITGRKGGVTKPWAHDTDRVLMCHYFNWFKTPDVRGGWHNWEWQGNGPKHNPEHLREDGLRDIASVYYPEIGPYDSADPDVIEYHMLTALAAKIDGFFIDWYGIHSDEEKTFPPLLEAAARYGFKMCICYEDKAMFGYYYDAESRVEAVQNGIDNLNYILETHAKHPAYLHIDGKPVVINFSWTEPGGTVKDDGFSSEEYKYILSEVRKKHDLYFVHDYHCHIKDQYWNAADNVYPWLDVNGDCLEDFYRQAEEAMQNGTTDFITTLIYPGFNNTGVWGWGEGPFVTPRESGALYERSWKRALQSDVRFLQIATWNDWGEGATIEAAREYGNQYLEITERHAAEWKKLNSQPELLSLPKNIYDLRHKANELKEDDPDTSAKLTATANRTVQLFAAGDTDEATRILQTQRGLGCRSITTLHEPQQASRSSQ